jgi:hypothetical protein
MSLTLSELIQEINKGDLALPDFQRDYRWADDFIVELLRSVARGWPIGSFLLLEQNGSTRLLSRPIAGGPQARAKPKRLILDGQQRATALYQALTGKGKRSTTFYIDMGALHGANEVSDEAIECLPDRVFNKSFGKGLDSHAQAKILRMQDLVSTAAFATWLEHVSDSKAVQKTFADLKDAHLTNFSAYALRTEEVSSELPMEAIAKIFERTNRSVLRLDAFDLMVAILYPHKFNLRKKWEAAKTSFEILSEYEVPGVEILKVIALREHLKQHDEVEEEKRKKISVGGVRQSDVLELDPKLVIRDWSKAVAAYAYSLEFLREHCGVVTRRILPQQTIILPIADAFFGHTKLSVPATQKLTRWFWAVCFERLYARGANTRAVTDAKLLRAWLGRGASVPGLVSEFSVGDESLRELDEGNDLVTAATLCLLNTLGARDWATESAKGSSGRKLSLTPKSTELSVHHVFPLEYLRSRVSRAKVQAEVPANQVLIDAGLNSSIRNAAPSGALNNSKVVPSALKSHLIDPETMRNDDFSAFVTSRSEKIAQAARRAVNPAP